MPLRDKARDKTRAVTLKQQTVITRRSGNAASGELVRKQYNPPRFSIDKNYQRSSNEAMSVLLSCISIPLTRTCIVRGQLKKKKVTRFMNVTVIQKVLN